MKQFTRLFFIAFSCSLPVTKNTDSNLITEFCKHSDDPKLCLSSIQARPEFDEFAATTNQIKIIAISAISANAFSTSAYIKEMFSREDLESATEATLEDCQKNYQDAVEQFDDSISVMLTNTHADVDVWMHAAISAIESCSNDLELRTWNNVILSQRNEVFLKLCKNVLVINKMLT